MANFDIDGVKYTSGMLDGSVQMKLSKRLLPIFTAIIGQAPKIQAAQRQNDIDAAAIAGAGDGIDEATTEVIRDGMASRMKDAVMPVSRELASLPDSDEDYIVNACLAVTQWRDSSGRWFAVRDAEGAINNDRNKSLIVRLKVTGYVIAENFAEMFSGFGVDIQKVMATASGGK